jgi:tetratricopeptide (TPR) repeat protein
LESANLVFLMLISIQKVSLFYLAVCFTVATTAVAVMTNGNASDRALPGDKAHATVTDLVEIAQLTIDGMPAPEDPPLQPKNPMQRASDAFQQGEKARQVNQGSVALTHYATALGISQDEGHQQFEAMIWQRIAKTYGAAHDYQQAEIHYKTAIKLAQAHHDAVVLGEAQADLAQIYETQGDRKRALSLYRQSLANLRQVGDRLTAQQVLQQTEKIAMVLERPAKPPVKPAKGVKPTPVQPAPSTVAQKSVTPTNASKVAIAPESIVLPPERFNAPPRSIEWVSDDVSQDPEPPIGSALGAGSM